MNTRIDDIATIIRGVSYKPEDLHPELDDSSVALLKNNNVNDDGSLSFDKVVYVDRAKVSSNQLLRQGDIIVCASGSDTLVGKAAQFNMDGEYTFGAFCKVVRPLSVSRRFLGLFFMSPHYRAVISASAQGAIMKNLRNEHLLDLAIDCPEAKLQKEIESKLDKVISIIHHRKDQLRTLDELVKARFVEMFGEPEFNTKAWQIVPLDTLCNVGSSKRIYQNEQSKDGVPFWRISDLLSKMDTGVAESGLFIPEERYMELKKSGLVPAPGDILVTSRGTLGRCYIIKDEDRFYFQDGMISWLSDYTESITPLYLQYLFMMPGFRKQIDNMQAGSTVAYLSIAMLKKLQVMVPSIETQEAFRKFVNQVDNSKVAAQKALDEAQLLFDSLMQQYFG